MRAILTIVLVCVGFLLGGPLYLRFWRWRCPGCAQRRLRSIGTASQWSAEWVETRYWEGQCGHCGGYAVRRMELLASWVLRRHERLAEECHNTGRFGPVEFGAIRMHVAFPVGAPDGVR